MWTRSEGTKINIEMLANSFSAGGTRRKEGEGGGKVRNLWCWYLVNTGIKQQQQQLCTYTALNFRSLINFMQILVNIFWKPDSTVLLNCNNHMNFGHGQAIMFEGRNIDGYKLAPHFSIVYGGDGG